MPPTTFLRAAARPRMLGLAVVLALAAVACGLLGTWQLGRAEVRGAQATAAKEQAVWGAPPVPIAELIDPQETFRGELVGRRAVVRGTFEDRSLLVAGRAHDGQVGYLALSPLRLDSDDDGDSAAPVVAVVRGWVPEPELVPPAPTGEVTVTGYLQAGESAGSGAGPDGAPLPAGQTDSISMGQLVNAWGGPIYTAYLVQSDPPPPPGSALVALDPPALPGTGAALRNVMYALQWWIFGGFAVFFWVRTVRDEARGAGPA